VSASLRALTPVFAQVGVESFGGPAAQIARMHQLLVEEHRLIDEDEFRHALGFCTLLPGPEAMQLVTWVGWRLHGVPGGLVAGGLFVLPGALLMAGIAAVVVASGDSRWFLGISWGLRAVVLAVIAEALVRLSKRAGGTPAHRALSLAGFVALFAFGVPFPVVIAAGGAVGAGWLASGSAVAAGPRPPVSDSFRTATTWLAVWWLPLFALRALDSPVPWDLALFFSQAAVVTFGGAYAVLAWVAQHVVVDRGWLSSGEMLDGLALAETTPGPLVLVLEYVGFVAAQRHGGFGFPWGGLIGAAVAVWATFAPCFLWIFTFAPWISWVRSSPRLAGALQGIGAVVVGVVANLGAFLAVHTWWPSSGLDLPAVALSSLATAAVLRHAPILAVLGCGAMLGLVRVYLLS
jgi:chromate transporter